MKFHKITYAENLIRKILITNPFFKENSFVLFLNVYFVLNDNFIVKYYLIIMFIYFMLY